MEGIVFLFLILIIGIGLPIVVGVIGSDRTIGFWGAFFISLIFSPVIGIIVVLLSKTKQTDELEKELLRRMREGK